MSNKNVPLDPTIPSAPTGGEDFKDQNLKYNLSKFEYDLYHEEDKKIEKIVRVKRTSLPNKGERWKIMVDNKILFTIEGNKISIVEREYLATINGFNFMLSQGKIGINSLNALRVNLKKNMESNGVSTQRKRGRPKKKK